MDTENAKQLAKLAHDICTDHHLPGTTAILFFAL